MRSNLPPNSVRMIENHIGKRGGGEWAFKALDPCAEIQTGGVRIPDQTIGDTVAFEYRRNMTISAPDKVTATDEWDCYVLSLPCPELPFVIMKKQAGVVGWPNFGDITSENFTPVPMPGINYGLVFPNKTSTPWQASTNGPSLGQFTTDFRTTFKGLSVLFDAPSLHNEGRVYSGQVRIEPTDSAVEILDNLGATTGYTHPSYIIDKIPYDEGALVSACPDYVRMKAKEGVYIPIRFKEQEHQYSKSSWEPVSTGDKAIATRYLGSLELGMIDSTGGIANGGQTAVKSGVYNLVVSGLDNTQIGVAIFKGMSGAANLDFKFRLGLEYAAAAGSPFAPAMERAPIPDRQALEDFFTIQEQLAVAYPEKYNSFGALIPLIGEAVQALAGWGIGRIVNWASSRVDKRPKYTDTDD